MTTHRRLLLPNSHQSSVQLTATIQAAIDDVAAQGGGTLRIGPGVWVVTTLFLRSGLRLYLEQGTVLQAETDLSLYPPQPVIADNKDQSAYHLIYAADCEDIALEGEGAIDGQDTHFWTRAVTEAERPYGIFDYYPNGDRPTPLVQIVRCRRVRVSGVTLQRSPGWTLHAFDCDEVQISGVRIRNHLMGPNADGITINGCRNVRVTGCDVITGDDAIGIKATNAGVPCDGVMVSDCIVETNCGAFILGAETLGGISNVVFSNCVARASLRLITIEMWDAGSVQNVLYNNICGANLPQPGVTCERPIYLDIQQFHRPTAELGTIRNVMCSNVICTTRGRIVLTAQDGAKLENIMLRDVHLDVPAIEDPRQAVPAARSWQNSNFNPETRAAPAALVADNVRGLILDNVSVTWPTDNSVAMHGLCLRNVEDATFNSPRLRANRPSILARLYL